MPGLLTYSIKSKTLRIAMGGKIGWKYVNSNVIFLKKLITTTQQIAQSTNSYWASLWQAGNPVLPTGASPQSSRQSGDKRPRLHPRREESLEEETETRSSVPAWKIPWTEEPGGLQPMQSRTQLSNWAQTSVKPGELNIHNYIWSSMIPHWKE